MENKRTISFIIDNLGNIFSIIGIVLTIYFSVFYVPSFVQNVENEKVKNINEELISIIEELVYEDSSLNITDIETLIKGKEIKYKIKYPYTINDLLIQTQEDFVENKFIPLNQRKELLKRIDKVRTLIVDEEIIPKNSFWEFETLISLMTAVLGTLTAFSGIYSLIKNSAKTHENEINEKIQEEITDYKSSFAKAFEYEKMILNILNELSPKLQIDSLTSDSNKFDFIIKKNKKRFFVEVKRYRHLLPLSTIQKIVGKNIQIKENDTIVIVTATDLTKTAQAYIEELRQNSINIQIIKGTSKSEISEGFKLLIS